MSQINELNLYLTNNFIKLNINEYFKEYCNKYYKDTDISFMDYFLSLVYKKNEFCVEHNKLKEYKVINTNKSSY